MALPTLPPDGLNPYGAQLRAALVDISNRADEALSDIAAQSIDLDNLESTVSSHTTTLTNHGSRITALESSVATKAADSVVVKTSGNQTIAGTKTFSSAPNVPDNAFAISKVNGLQTQLNAKASVNNPTFTGTISGIDKDDVGLNLVDNTSDMEKPVSNPQQAALNLKADTSDLTSRIQTHNHTGGVNGTPVPQSGVSGLTFALATKQDNLRTASGSSAHITVNTADFIMRYFYMRRWGAIAFVTMAFETKFAIGNNTAVGNFANKTIATINGSSEFADLYQGAANSTYDAMVYPMASGADGAVVSGYLTAITREFKLSASVPVNFGDGYTFSLNGVFLLNSDTN